MFKITYLKGSRINFTRDPKVKVITEDLSDLVNLSTCSSYLSERYPNLSLTQEVLNRFLVILKLGVAKTNHVEGMSSERVDMCFYTWFYKHGVSSSSKRSDLEYILSIRDLVIPCYDLAYQTPDICNERNFDNVSYRWPTFRLIKLLQNDDAFEIFHRFWSNIPDYEQCCEPLLQIFPKDIVNYIFELE